jgi:hypothetical protein
MPGAGRSDSRTVRLIGAIVALVAVVGYLAFGWSFDDSGNTVPTVVGVVAAITAVGWTLYSRVRAA